MKQLLEFLKTTAMGGLFILLPILLFYLLLAELLGVMVALASPIAELFPQGTFERVNAPVLVAVVLIIGASFLLGLALRSMTLQRVGHWTERTVLGRLPLYGAVKRLSRGLVGAKGDTAFRTAVLNSAGGVREIVYIIEDHVPGTEPLGRGCSRTADH